MKNCAKLELRGNKYYPKFNPARKSEAHKIMLLNKTSNQKTRNHQNGVRFANSPKLSQFCEVTKTKSVVLRSGK